MIATILTPLAAMLLAPNAPAPAPVPVPSTTDAGAALGATATMRSAGLGPNRVCMGPVAGLDRDWAKNRQCLTQAQWKMRRVVFAQDR